MPSSPRPIQRDGRVHGVAVAVRRDDGKWLMVRKLLAQALAARVGRGQYTAADALSIARTILFETPQTLLVRTGVRTR